MEGLTPPLHSIQIHQHTFVGSNVSFSPDFTNGYFRYEPITVEKNVFLGSNSSVISGTLVRELSQILPLSAVEGTTESGRTYVGIPATLINTIDARTLSVTHYPKPSYYLALVFKNIPGFILQLLLPPLLLATSIGVVAACIIVLLLTYPTLWDTPVVPHVTVIFALFPLAYIAFMLIYTLLYVLLKWMLLGRVKSGTYSVDSWWWIRYTTFRLLTEQWNFFCGKFLLGTPWLTGVEGALGASVCRDTLLFELFHIPDLVTTGRYTIVESEARLGEFGLEEVGEGGGGGGREGILANVMLSEVEASERCIFGKRSVVCGVVGSDVIVPHGTLHPPSMYLATSLERKMY
eukprot:TRINITY_DN1841_c0_g1_i1.p1 TRINITY_DN1841_c0_g1~~TRINITY_DN1841_c0_g1_i1.p1  ORF type:complete len:403 (-),score=58.35 TRINITY_DN1841_c0_g1_i1:41-1084(-)